MSSGAVSPILQLVITAVGTSGIFGLLTIKQSRQKLRAETDKAGVDATAVLTGEAMEMVKEVRDQAKEARTQASEARSEAATATAEARQAHMDAQEARVQFREAQRRMSAMERHLTRLEEMIRSLGGDPPRFVWPQGNDSDYR